MDKYRLMDSKIKIESIPDEHDPAKDFEASFRYNNRRYYLSDFIRTKNNAWVSGEFPDFIDAFESEEYYNPLFLHINDDETVDVYEACQHTSEMDAFNS